MSDYIRREDASCAISELLLSPYANGDTVFSAGVKDCLKLIKNMVDDNVSDALKIPTADVRENVSGEWIDTTNYFMRWQCSVCGNHTRDARPPYCPNCGADMRQQYDDNKKNNEEEEYNESKT